MCSVSASPGENFSLSFRGKTDAAVAQLLIILSNFLAEVTVSSASLVRDINSKDGTPVATSCRGTWTSAAAADATGRFTEEVEPCNLTNARSFWRHALLGLFHEESVVVFY